MKGPAFSRMVTMLQWLCLYHRITILETMTILIKIVIQNYYNYRYLDEKANGYSDLISENL